MYKGDVIIIEESLSGFDHLMDEDELIVLAMAYLLMRHSGYHVKFLKGSAFADIVNEYFPERIYNEQNA